MHFGIIGFPLTHSFSQNYFTEKFLHEGIDGRYDKFPLEKIEDFPSLLASHPALLGLNVTIPYKETIIPYLHALDPIAESVGAVNVIKINQGRLTGYNSDVYGFEKSFVTQYQERFPRQNLADETGEALILGTGGAAKAVAWVLRQNHINYRFVSRKKPAPERISYQELRAEDFSKIRWIINTTPLGTFPNTADCPDLPFDLLGPQHLVFDLIYNPAETLLLQRASAQGSSIRNGMEMLHLQAEKAWEIWQSPSP
ncbi:MAG: shikimate dehydrogenase [Lewinellaceae bacterium]|nr:shikimate dehydrogenase [Lewinellaceae bacterium]